MKGNWRGYNIDNITQQIIFLNDNHFLKVREGSLCFMGKGRLGMFDNPYKMAS